MTETRASNKRLRDTQRLAHILGGLMLGIYIYIPLVGGSAPRVAEALMQAVVFPAVAATGLLMWQLPRLRRRLKTGWGERKSGNAHGPRT